MRPSRGAVENFLLNRTPPQVSRSLIETYWLTKYWRFRTDLLVKHPPEVVFVWVPKTAGSALARWLRKLADLREVHNVSRLSTLDSEWVDTRRAVTFGHQDIDALVRVGALSSSGLNEAFSFSVVRNPFSRAISLWHHLKKIGRYHRAGTFDEFVAYVAARAPRPGLYNQFGLSMASPMSCWIRQQRWQGPQNIYRFEDLHTGVAEIAHRLSIREDFRPRNVGPSQRKPLSVSAKTLRLLQDFYREDFSRFGYDLEPPPALISPSD